MPSNEGEFQVFAAYYAACQLLEPSFATLSRGVSPKKWTFLVVQGFWIFATTPYESVEDVMSQLWQGQERDQKALGRAPE